jgi:membrane protease YdiL (CAAX protease family)
MLLPAVWITKKWHSTEIKKYLRIKWISLKEIFLAVLITVTLLPLCYFISYLILEWLDIPDVIQNLGSQLFTAHSFTEFILLVFVVAVTPAICEEVFFRGYVQRTMERNMGVKSFVITGIIFGLFHMQPLGLISLSILGVLFSFFFYRSQSIFPSSAAHFVNNFIALLLLYLPMQSAENEIIFNGVIPLVWVLFSTLISAVLIFIYIRSTKNHHSSYLLSPDV